MKLNITALGIAWGATTATALIIYSAIAYFTGVGIELELAFESLYPGYSLTLPGTIVGAIWQFSAGFAAAALLGWLYNALLDRKS